MNNFNIGGRLNTLILTINLGMLILIGIVATVGSNATLRADVIQRFETKTALVASNINTNLTLLYEATLRLADNVGAQGDLEDANALRGLMLDYFANDDPQALIHRVSIYRPDGSVGTLRYSNRAFDANDYLWRVYRAENDIPLDDERIFGVLEDEAPHWFLQDTAYYDTTDTPVLSLATTYYDSDGEPLGVMWVDVPLDLLRDLVGNLIGDEGLLADTLSGYNLLFSDTANILAYNVPRDSTPFIAQAVADYNALTSVQSQDVDDVLLNAEAIVNRRPISITGWHFVSVLPIEEIPILPTNIGIPILVVAAVGLLTLFFLLGRTVRANIVQPINSLANAAQEIGSGDMRYVIDHQWRNDEIGRLSRALDDMKSNISHSYGELSRLNRGLEQRVRERTQELEEARAVAILRADELRAVYDESLVVVSETQLGRVLEALVERVQPLLNVTYCAIWLRDSETGRLQLTTTNHPQHSEEIYVIRDDEGLAGQAIKAGEPILVDDYTRYPHRITLEGFERGAPFIRAMGIPMSFAQQSIGAIIVGRGEGAASFSADDARILGLLANLVSPTVRNAQLFIMTQNAMQEASRANNVKTRFLASVTHELRTPLNLIINNMDFMRIGAFGDVTDEQKQRLNQTVRSSEHLLYLINDLLDVSKIDAGEMQLFMQDSDVYTMLEDSVDNTYALIEKIPEKEGKVTLVTEIDEELPTVEMDVRRIRQVLTNLLSNAVKFTAEGEIKLTVSARPNGIYFSVRDQGMGIPKDQMDKLFRAFERTDQARNDNIEGTGLGLPISQYLVQQHGGEILVSSQVGKGSEFSFILPYVQKKIDDSQELTRSQISAMTRSDLFGGVVDRVTKNTETES
jgi:signal transduction histidine kinase/HAMP domain-containing protein